LSFTPFSLGTSKNDLAWLTNALLRLVIDAVPKKRGPKTDVLEALLKRVDGLEAKLKEKKAGEETPTTPTTAAAATGDEPLPTGTETAASEGDPNPKRLALDTGRGPGTGGDSAIYSPAPPR
jgi:hypothetical protein